jgi:hypothetical protein
LGTLQITLYYFFSRASRQVDVEIGGDHRGNGGDGDEVRHGGSEGGDESWGGEVWVRVGVNLVAMMKGVMEVMVVVVMVGAMMMVVAVSVRRVGATMVIVMVWVGVKLVAMMKGAMVVMVGVKVMTVVVSVVRWVKAILI